MLCRGPVPYTRLIEWSAGPRDNVLRRARVFFVNDVVRGDLDVAY